MTAKRADVEWASLQNRVRALSITSGLTATARRTKPWESFTSISLQPQDSQDIAMLAMISSRR